MNKCLSLYLLAEWIKLVIVCLSLAIKGYKMPLEAKDLWSLNPRDSSKVMVPKLLREWEKEQAKARRYVAVTLGFVRFGRGVSVPLFFFENRSLTFKMTIERAEMYTTLSTEKNKTEHQKDTTTQLHVQ